MVSETEIKKIPEYLIYEMVDGKPIYYRGYKEVLNGTKKSAQIIGGSSLQAWLKSQVSAILVNNLGKDYVITVEEHGLYFSKKSWRAADLAIFKKENFELNDKFAKKPPEIVIEIDLKAEIQDGKTPMDEIVEKTQELHDFGVKKVIWIFSKVKKVMICEPQKEWTTADWNKDIPILNDFSLNIQDVVDSF